MFLIHFEYNHGKKNEKKTTTDFGVCKQQRCRPACEQHPYRLISTFVILFLKSILYKLAAGEVSIFQLNYVAEETGLRQASKTGFISSKVKMSGAHNLPQELPLINLLLLFFGYNVDAVWPSALGIWSVRRAPSFMHPPRLQ